MSNRKLHNLLLLVLLTASLFIITCAWMYTAKSSMSYEDNNIDVDVIIDISAPTHLRVEQEELNNVDEHTLVADNKQVEESYTLNSEELLGEVKEEQEENIIVVIEDNPKYLYTNVGNKKQFVNTSTTLRLGPGENFGEAHQVKLNTELVVTHEVDNGWSEVVYNDKQYYCLTKQLQNDKVYVAPPYDEVTGVMKFDGNVSKSCRDKAISLYRKIPSNMIEAIRNNGYTIIVSSRSYWTDGHCGTYYPNGYNWGDKTGKIAVYAKSVWAVDIAVIHEAGHWLDDYLGSKEGWGRTGYYGYTGVTSDPTWVSIYNEEVGKSGYPSWANYCPEEYFAESVWKALANPSWCSKTLPKTYDYVMNCINRVN